MLGFRKKRWGMHNDVYYELAICIGGRVVSNQGLWSETASRSWRMEKLKTNDNSNTEMVKTRGKRRTITPEAVSGWAAVQTATVVNCKACHRSGTAACPGYSGIWRSMSPRSSVSSPPGRQPTEASLGFDKEMFQTNLVNWLAYSSRNMSRNGSESCEMPTRQHIIAD